MIFVSNIHNDAKTVRKNHLGVFFYLDVFIKFIKVI